MKRVLVTGGAGFVGKALLAALKKNQCEIRVLDLVPVDGVEAMQGSVLDDDIVAKAVDGIDTIFHLAGNAQLWTKSDIDFEIINVDGTKNIVRQAIRARVKRFIHCSSLTTLVGKSTPIGFSSADESVLFAPDELLGAYPRSKRRAELAVLDAVEEGLNAVIAIPTEPIGAGDVSMTPPTQMIADFINRKTPASIDCSLNFVPVQSLAEGLIAAANHGRSGQRYVLGGNDISMAELLDSLEKITRVPMPKLQLPYWVALAAGYLDTSLSGVTGKPPKAPLTGVRLAGRRVSFLSEKAKKELAWEASLFEPALIEAVQWLKHTGKIQHLT